MKKLKSAPINGILLVLLVLVACIFSYFATLRMNAKNIGGGLGTGAGSIVGKAIGSLEGMTKGRKEGTEAGRSAGLSAEDTSAEIATELQQTAELEVLVASVKLKDFHTIGDDINYAALYLVNGNVVFTVDLSQADIEPIENGLHVTLPSPKGTLYLDESSVKKVAEYQKKFFNGSAEDGFDAYLNTMKHMQEASEETLNNYDTLISAAKESAKKQVLLLAQGVQTGSKEIHIDFKNEGGDDHEQ